MCVSCTTLRKEKDLPVGDEVDFVEHIKPILGGQCIQCHNKTTAPDRVSFETRELAMMPGRHGQAIVPGDPDISRMVSFINAPRDTGVAMPQMGHEVSQEDAETIREWIAAGAKWPSGSAGRVALPGS